MNVVPYATVGRDNNHVHIPGNFANGEYWHFRMMCCDAIGTDMLIRMNVAGTRE